MDFKATFSMGESESENYWSLIFEPKNLDILREQEKLHWIYFAKVDVYSGRIKFVDSYYSMQKKETTESPETNLNNIEDHKKIAEGILTNKLNAKNIEFQKAYTRKSVQHISFNKSLYLVYKAEDRYVEIEFLYGSKKMVSILFFDNLEKLNQRIDKIEQESIANKIDPKINGNISTNVQMHDSQGNEITVYEMSEEEYQNTDFRQKP